MSRPVPQADALPQPSIIEPCLRSRGYENIRQNNCVCTSVCVSLIQYYDTIDGVRAPLLRRINREQTRILVEESAGVERMRDCGAGVTLRLGKISRITYRQI